MTEKTTPKAPADLSAAPDLDAMRTKEASLLAERNALLEAENAALRARRSPSQADPTARAIAAQMANNEPELRRGVHHISEFSAAGVDYRGKAEDVANLEAAQQD